MLWRPKDRHDLASFEAEICAHCIERHGEGDWEDEFGNDIPSRCPLIDYAFTGPLLQWTVKDGRRDCCCFIEDPANPARCPKTMEMFT